MSIAALAHGLLASSGLVDSAPPLLDTPTHGLISFLQVQAQPLGAVCRDDEGKVRDGCFIVAYILYLLLNGLLSTEQGAPRPAARVPPPPTHRLAFARSQGGGRAGHRPAAA